MQATLLPDVTKLLVETEDGAAWLPTPHGAVVLSQTCDVAQGTRHSVVVSPLVLLDGSQAVEAGRGNMPRFAPVWSATDGDAEQANPMGFADLEVVATWAKARLACERQVPGSWHTSSNTRRFARAVGRRFSRFAFPDDIQPWLRPLERVLQARYDESKQATGRVVAGLLEVRVQADDWSAPGAHLTLHFIFEEGVLPPGELDEAPSENCRTLIAREPTWKELAEALDGAEAPADRAALYVALGEAWATLCRPDAKSGAEVQEAVAEVEGQTWSADEFSLTLVRAYPNLDVDYVSEPVAGS